MIYMPALALLVALELLLCVPLLRARARASSLSRVRASKAMSFGGEDGRGRP